MFVQDEFYALFSMALAIINSVTGEQFIVIFDEWDYPIRERTENSRERMDYIEFLRGLFKGGEARDYIRLAYLTGILPMVRAKGQSAVNMEKGLRILYISRLQNIRIGQSWLWN